MTLAPEQREDLERRVEMAQQLETARQQRPTLWYGPHAGQLAFHRAPHTVRALFPGNGFGKTRAAGTEANWWLRHSHPWQKIPKWPISVVWGCESYKQFDMLRAQLEDECFDAGWAFNGTKNCYEWPDGDRLFLISYDSDWTNVQGINPDLVIFDEEPPLKLWKEMRMRRRGKRKTRYCFAATATKGLTWMHSEIYLPWLKHHQEAGLDESGAIAAQTHENFWVWPRGGIDDNPGADESDRKWYRSHRYNSEAERRVRLFGGFEDFSGTPVFDLQGLERFRAGLSEGRSGRLVGEVKQSQKWEFIADGPTDFGRMTIWEDPSREQLPQADGSFKPGQINHAYVIGADFAYGLEGGDFDYAVVIDRNTRRQVAEAQGKWGDSQWDTILEQLYWYYGEAFLLGERQVGLPVLRRLYDKGVHFQFFNRDDATPGRRHTDKLGHHSSVSDLVIPRLRRAVGSRTADGKLVDPEITIVSPELFRQMGKYQFRPRSSTKGLDEVHDDELIFGAPSGDHDDGVRALSFANMALGEVARFPEPAKAKYTAQSAGLLLDHDEVFKPKDEDE